MVRGGGRSRGKEWRNLRRERGRSRIRLRRGWARVRIWRRRGRNKLRMSSVRVVIVVVVVPPGATPESPHIGCTEISDAEGLDGSTVENEDETRLIQAKKGGS